jgi:hypothetical protein
MHGFDFLNTISNEEKIQMVIKKVSTSGQLLANKFLPYRPYCLFTGYLNKVGNGSAQQLLQISLHLKEWQNASTHPRRNCVMRLTWLDTNLNITKTDSFFSSRNFNIEGTKTLKNGDVLCFGSSDLDTSSWRLNKQGYELYGWACRISPQGQVKWERNYNVRDSVEHYLRTADEDEDGSIYLGGCIFPNKTEKQAALIIKIDSNGCLGTTFCDPLGVHEIKYLPPTQLLLFPNPTSQHITLQIPDAQYLGGQAIIYGIDGKIVQTIPNVQATQTIAVNNLVKGNYWLHYKVGDWRGYVQFVVQ